MRFEEFEKTITEKVKNRLENIKIRNNIVIKNNGVKLHGISIISDKSNISPNIYLDCFYKEYKKGNMKIEEIVDGVVDIYNEHASDYNFDIKVIADFSKVSKLLRVRLVNTEKNKEMLEKIPHREWLDLSLIYAVDIETDNKEEMCSMRVTDMHMHMWGVDEETLYNNAMENMKSVDGGIVLNMAEMMKEICGNNVDFDDTVPMYVLTNESRMNGAVQILNEQVLAEFANKMQNDFIILPSSIHEVLLVPVDNGVQDTKYLAQMVREVNDTSVTDEEILSYHVYLYDMQTGTIEIAA